MDISSLLISDISDENIIDTLVDSSNNSFSDRFYSLLDTLNTKYTDLLDIEKENFSNLFEMYQYKKNNSNKNSNHVCDNQLRMLQFLISNSREIGGMYEGIIKYINFYKKKYK